jgi:hypothetical protein
VSSRTRTQRVTAADIAAGRIRIPITTETKEFFPQEKAQVTVALKGIRLSDCLYDPRLGPDRERSGVLRVPRELLESEVGENEVLPVHRGRNGVIYVGDRGSKLRIAQWIDRRPTSLSQALLERSTTIADFGGVDSIDWVAPTRANDFIELKADFWKKLDLPDPTPHEDGFWPANQPNWDAIATVEGPYGLRGVVLVEAKSHIAELASSAGASEGSLRVIRASLAATQRYIGTDESVDWTVGHYQAANRLAFLYYLRARRNIPAWLFFVYFTGDEFEVNDVPQACPPDEAGWRPTVDRMHADLGLLKCHPLSSFVTDVFLPAKEP